MSWFHNIKIFPKLLVSLFVVMAIATGIGIFSARELGVLHEATRKIVDDEMQSIVLVSSAMHLMGIPGHTAYAATKAALRSYARTWAVEFKDRGIRVNVLSPGVTDTPILDSQSATREALVNMYQSMVPIGRLARAEEIAGAALFLASDQSSYMTGADLMSDGGIGQV